MRKTKELIGMPVLSLSAGKRLCEVKDILFDASENRALALLVEEGVVAGTSKVIPFENIKCVGRDAVLVQDESAIVPTLADERTKSARERRKLLTGVSIYTEDGRYLGKIDDLYIDEDTGLVTGYDLSGGIIETTLRGRRFLPSQETTVMGRDIVFVSSETGTRLEDEVTGGFKTVMAETQRRGEEAGRRATEQFTSVRNQIIQSSVEMQKEFVVGKTAENNVTAADGTSIVSAGDTISRQMADEAEKHGALIPLVSSAGTAQARGTAERIGKEARSALTQIKEAFGGGTKDDAEKAEETRIKVALGRPVTRVILDKNDNVILSAWDIVTYAAIAQAREAGVLDILLDSATREEPKSSPGVDAGHASAELGQTDDEMHIGQ